MKNLTANRVNEGHFPAKYVEEMPVNPDADGISIIDPKSPYYGISVRYSLPINDFLDNFNHEIAHWSTLNAGKNELINRMQAFSYRLPYQSELGDIMRYNDKIAPMRSWADFRNTLPKKMPASDVED